MIKSVFASLRSLLVAASLCTISMAVLSQSTIKLAYIDPLSGSAAVTGEHGARHFQYLVEKVNSAGGVLGGKKIELLLLDNKGAPQETLVQAQKAIDAGARFIFQGFGSNVALALTDFLAKHNDRNPDSRVLYISYGPMDPALTNAKCNFWHYRFESDSNVKISALAEVMRNKPDIKKVYIINQDYSFGQSVRSEARKQLQDKRQDVAIVGDELHPLLKVNDFSPYVAKIQASGADTVITGNWGADLSLLLKAAGNAGLKAQWYTIYGGLAGGPTAIKQAGLDGRVFQVVNWHANVPGAEMQALNADFRRKYNDQGWWYLQAKTSIDMLVQAIEKVGSADAVKVGQALEGVRAKNALGAEVLMRKDDHQLIQDLYVASFGSGVSVDEEKTGWGWKTVAAVPASALTPATTCRMSRPE